MHKAGVRRLVLASSMVVYGEGRYACTVHGIVPASPRQPEDLAAGRYEVPCPHCGADLKPLLVREDIPLDPRSTYAATKLAQEQLAAAWARQTGGAVWALRYHNVYGARMPRDTPYAGVASIFRSALARGEAPQVMEDGRQRRDFVHVSDVAQSMRSLWKPTRCVGEPVTSPEPHGRRAGPPTGSRDGVGHAADSSVGARPGCRHVTADSARPPSYSLPTQCLPRRGEPVRYSPLREPAPRRDQQVLTAPRPPPGRPATTGPAAPGSAVAATTDRERSQLRSTSAPCSPRQVVGQHRQHLRPAQHTTRPLSPRRVAPGAALPPRPARTTAGRQSAHTQKL